MDYSLQILSDFIKVFTGNMSGHGSHIYEPIKDGEVKERGKSWTEQTEPVTDAFYIAHLKGEKGLGISPITENNQCYFGVIDDDRYIEEETQTIISLIYKYNLPIFPFRSKSNGLHLYIFFETSITAKEMVELCGAFRSLLGLPKDIEIFPKQSSLSNGSIGNWINLPYHNMSDSIQYLIKRDFSKASVEEAILLILKKRSEITIESVKTFLGTLPLSDAPPCLQSIYLRGTTKFRNEYLFSLARYYKTKFGDDFEFYISEANTQLENPLQIDELNKSVISSHKKKEYTYACKKEPICSLCDKSLCKTKQYGIGGEQVSDLSFEELRKYNTDPPYYEWIINGETLKFFSESDIINQARFQELCFRILHSVPTKLLQANWIKIINTALSNLQVVDVATEEDISPGTALTEHLQEFLECRVLAKTKEQIMLDRVYKDVSRGSYIFRVKNFINFLYVHKQFRYYGYVQLQDKLKSLGARPIRYYASTNIQNIRAWELPFTAIDKFVDNAKISDFIIDFDDSKDTLEEF